MMMVVNDFHTTLMWIRAMEIAIGHTIDLMLAELEMPLFALYRPQVRA